MQVFFSSSHYFFAKKKSRTICTTFLGAGDEARTRYLHLGKVALYRMSYTRMGLSRKELSCVPRNN